MLSRAPHRLRLKPFFIRQKGQLLLLTLAIVTVIASYVVVTGLGRAAQNSERDRLTNQALAEAKQALLAYAATYGDTHANQPWGYLPCPADPNAANEGTALTGCGATNVSVLGRLPWRTLGMPAPRDGNGECLWYAVSGTYKNSPKTPMLNWDTDGQFEVVAANGTTFLAGPSGTNPDSLAVAVIFAPGGVTGSQDRAASANTPSCGGNYAASNYLETDTPAAANNAVVSGVANAVNRYIAGPNANVNDKMVFITKDEIYNAMAPTLRRLTQKTAECVAYYGATNGTGASDKRLPWASFVALSDYTNNAYYNDEVNQLSGRLPNLVGSSGTTAPAHTVFNTTSSPGNELLGNSGANCPVWGGMYPAWNEWKSFLFYALAGNFTPGSGTPSACGTCLTVNGVGPYAGAVMFAGKKLSALGQTHTTNADKSNIANYLEGRNLTNHPNAAGNSDYEKAAATASFNDILYCVAPDLSVAPCP